MTTSSNLAVLVTGGAGFLGSALIWALNAKGITNITIVDRLGKTDKWRNLVGLKYETYLEVDSFRVLMDSPYSKGPRLWDVIFHLGACSSTREQDASYLIRNNYDFSIGLADYAARHKIRFIYASSAATYGLGKRWTQDLPGGLAKDIGMSDDLSPDDCRPINPYAFSKNAFDQYAARAGWLDSMVGLKFFNIYGPNSRHKGVMVDFVAKTFDQIKETGKATLFDTHLRAPNGKDARDFLYVKDAADMMVHFAFGTGAQSHGLFNIGSGEAWSWTHVAATVAEAMGWKGSTDGGGLITYKPLPPDLAPKFQYYTCADISKLRASGYTAPITPIADAIRDYVTNYLMLDKRLGETL